MNVDLEIKQIKLFNGVADLRKGRLGLLSLLPDVDEHVLYLFSNRTRSLLKCLLIDSSGVWLLTRRLSRGGFHWPEKLDSNQILSLEQLHWLVTGQDLKKLKKESELSCK